jgi:hypothetical protein
MIDPNNFTIKEKKTMRKLYSSWAVAMLAVSVMLCFVSTARSQYNFIPQPTLSLRNWHCNPDGIQRVPGPANGADRYFLVPVWIWNNIDTTKNPNIGGQHLEPIRSFSFQFWYYTQSMVLDTGHGSPLVMTGPDTGTKALANTFYCTFLDQDANNPLNPYQHVITIAGASSVPLPPDSTADSGCSEQATPNAPGQFGTQGVLMWLRFKVVISNVQGGVIYLDSVKMNEHYGDSIINASGGPSLDYHHGNLGGGDGQFGASDKGRGDIEITAQPIFQLKPLSQVSEGYLGEPFYDSLTEDLVYDPTSSTGEVTREIDLSDAAGNTEIDNVTITSNESWLSLGNGQPGSSEQIFLPGDAIDYTTGISSTIIPLYLTVGSPQTLAPGIYYATVTFTSYGTSNSPLTLIIRFVRLASPDEPVANGTGTGIRLNITNSCTPSCTTVLDFGTGPGATDGIDELYGEHAVTTEDIQGDDTATPPTCYAYFKPLNLNVDPAFLASDFLGLNRDIRSDLSDTTMIYAVVFSPGNSTCYPVTVCVNPADFPAGGSVIMKFSLNGNDQGINLRTATVDPATGLNCVTITDQRINEFYIFYTPARIVNIATDLKLQSWTLISLPVVPPDLYAPEIFPNAVTPPYVYSSQSGWGQPQGDSMQFGVGYMIRYGDYLGTDGIVAGGISYTVSNVKISEGWNSVGATSGWSDVSDLPLSNTITFTPNPNSTNVPQLQSDFVWEYTPQTGYNQTEFMTPGRGYFIKVNYSGYYNLVGTPQITQQSQVPSGKMAERDNLQGQLAQVLVRDADANGQSLYFGNATTSFDESKFEMPARFQDFDARFDINSGMMSYNHPSYVVDLHTASYPMTLTFTNLSGPVDVTDMNGNPIATSVTNNGIVTISDPSIAQVRIAEKQDNAGSNMVGYSLDANSPNPFTQTSTIQYSLPQESVVSLVVYDELGNVVQNLVNGVVGAGTHTATFVGTGLPSGNYYYTLKAGNFVQTQSMTLSK